eukprot:4425567-Alexandrium_andersonii.AAC.1
MTGQVFRPVESVRRTSASPARCVWKGPGATAPSATTSTNDTGRIIPCISWHLYMARCPACNPQC